jgi:pyruvate/2-oxoglutarate dehydrogenase complex dihydrolipoamide acyltransferase (E2) component
MPYDRTPQDCRMPVSPAVAQLAHEKAMANQGLERIKSGRITEDEVIAILIEVRSLLEQPQSTERTDRLEDEVLGDTVHRALKWRAMQRSMGREQYVPEWFNRAKREG